MSGRTRSFPGARYRQMAGHMPKKKALVSTGNSALTIVHALLSDPEANHQDPGAICYEQRVRTAAKPQ